MAYFLADEAGGPFELTGLFGFAVAKGVGCGAAVVADCCSLGVLWAVLKGV